MPKPSVGLNNPPANSLQEALPAKVKAEGMPLGTTDAKLPTNDQITSLLDHTVDAFEQQRSKITKPSGQRVVDDVEQILTDTKDFIKEKNRDNLLQNLLRHATNASELSAKAAQQFTGEAVKGAKESLQKPAALSALAQDTRAAVDALVRLTKLVVTSSRFRDILLELQDILWDAISRGVDLAQNLAITEMDILANQAKKQTDVLASTLAQLQGPATNFLGQAQSSAVNIIDKGTDATARVAPVAVREGERVAGKVATAAAELKDVTLQHSKSATAEIRQILDSAFNNAQGILAEAVRTGVQSKDVAISLLEQWRGVLDHVESNVHLKSAVNQFNSAATDSTSVKDKVSRLQDIVNKHSGSVTDQVKYTADQVKSSAEKLQEPVQQVAGQVQHTAVAASRETFQTGAKITQVAQQHAVPVLQAAAQQGSIVAGSAAHGASVVTTQAAKEAAGLTGVAAQEAARLAGATGILAGQAMISGQQYRLAATALGQEYAHEAAGAVQPSVQQFKSGVKETGDLASGLAKSVASGTKEAAKDILHSKHPLDTLESETQSALGSGKAALSEALDKAVEIGAISDEHREILIARWKSLLTEVNQNPEFRTAFNDFFTLLRRFKEDIVELEHEVEESAQNLAGSVTGKTHQRNEAEEKAISEWKAALVDAKHLLEHLANGQSMDPLLSATKEWAVKMKTDPKLNALTHEISDYFQKATSDPNVLADAVYVNRISKLADQSRLVLWRHYHHMMRKLVREGYQFANGFKRDEATLKLASDFQNLVQDLFLDDAGKFQFKAEQIDQLRRVLVPILLENIKSIPVARFQETSDTLDFVVDNLLLDFRDILPEQVEIRNVTDFKLDRQNDKHPTELTDTLHISVSGINVNIENARFAFAHKTTPKIADDGEIDVHIPGKGISFEIDLKLKIPTSPEEHLMFETANCHCHIDKLDLKLHHTHHDFLYKLAHPLFVTAGKKAVEKTVEIKLNGLAADLTAVFAAARRKAAVIGGLKGAVGAKIAEYRYAALEAKDYITEKALEGRYAVTDSAENLILAGQKKISSLSDHQGGESVGQKLADVGHSIQAKAAVVGEHIQSAVAHLDTDAITQSAISSGSAVASNLENRAAQIAVHAKEKASEVQANAMAKTENLREAIPSKQQLGEQVEAAKGYGLSKVEQVQNSVQGTKTAQTAQKVAADPQGAVNTAQAQAKETVEAGKDSAQSVGKSAQEWGQAKKNETQSTIQKNL